MATRTGFEDRQKALDFMRLRKGSYQGAFGSPAGEKVLQDLAEFCRADITTFHPDPRIHAALEGRREVYLRIMQHLNLSGEQLVDLYSRAPQQDNS